MNLISCDECGVVYDLDKVEIPMVRIDEDNSSWEEPKYSWYDKGTNEYVSQFKCKICDNLVDVV